MRVDSSGRLAMFAAIGRASSYQLGRLIIDAAVCGRSQEKPAAAGMDTLFSYRSTSLAVAPSGLLDLPRRIMRNVHRGIAARPSQRRHCIAGKWLTPSDPCIFAGAARDDMGAATHAWLRLVDVAGIEGREDLVSVGVGQDTGSIDVLLGARVDAQR